LNTEHGIQDEYFEQSKEKYILDGGMPSINLKEITIKAVKKTDVQNEYFSGMADNEITSEQIDKFPSMSILNFLYTIPGINITGNNISIRGSMHSPLILVDDVEMQNIDEISYLTSFDVENIQVFKGASASIFGARGGNGVIAIALKKGSSNYTATTPISLANIIPLGYQKPVQFYVPKYDVDSVLKSQQPDLRTTIYWNPDLVPDSKGTIHVRFYTADKETSYSVVMEGITETGEICRYIGYLKREGN
jgi:TonB-dependent SusC/RagA subfamily outer membrane receptor